MPVTVQTAFFAGSGPLFTHVVTTVTGVFTGTVCVGAPTAIRSVATLVTVIVTVVVAQFGGVLLSHNW